MLLGAVSNGSLEVGQVCTLFAVKTTVLLLTSGNKVVLPQYQKVVPLQYQKKEVQFQYQKSVRYPHQFRLSNRETRIRVTESCKVKSEGQKVRPTSQKILISAKKNSGIYEKPQKYRAFLMSHLKCVLNGSR